MSNFESCASTFQEKGMLQDHGGVQSVPDSWCPTKPSKRPSLIVSLPFLEPLAGKASIFGFQDEQ
jgi:hypothetical protein